MTFPKDKYHLGEEKNLEIIVHVWGEVKTPGEKRVFDGTNILELISKAGGPTEYSDLSKVLLFRDQQIKIPYQNQKKFSQGEEAFILENYRQLEKMGQTEIDINKYLKAGKSGLLPPLFPGDVVQVRRNIWYKWQTAIKVFSQVAIIAQVWYWYTR